MVLRHSVIAAHVLDPQFSTKLVGGLLGMFSRYLGGTRNLARTPLVHNAASALPTQKVWTFRGGAIPLFYILFIHSDTALIMSTTTIVSPSNLSAIPAGALTTNSHETSSERMSKRRYHIPRPATREAERRWQLEQMAGTFRIFAKLGFADGGSGHISVRGAFSIDSVQDDIPTN